MVNDPSIAARPFSPGFWVEAPRFSVVESSSKRYGASALVRLEALALHWLSNVHCTFNSVQMF